MDRHRGDRYGDNSSPGNYSEDSYYDRRPSRFSDGPRSRYNGVDNYNRRSPSSYRVGSHRPFDSPPRRSPIGGGGVGGGGGGFLPFGGSDDGGGGFRPLGGSDVAAGGGVGFRPMGSGGGGFGSNYEAPLPQPLSGQKRGFGGRGGSPDRFDGGSFAKLFVGSVPRTAIESDIRPLFEEHGNVIEVAFLKDKRTGQQQGCCFIKYATSAEADRAIRALHNLVTLPGGLGPIQVRYADGERERLGAVEYKLFVGSLNKQATEKEVEEIFSAYGRVEDVYLMRDEMRQSRGCGFVKYSNRDMALAAINALNGIFTMRGCDQPLTVRFADPKRPRPGESRGGPAYGGPGFGPRFQAPGPRPPPNVGEAFGDRIPPTAWHPMAQQNLGPSSNATIRGFGGQLLPRSGDLALPLNQGGPLGGPSDGNPPGLVVSSAAQQTFGQPLQQIPPVAVGQQISTLPKSIQSPHHLPPFLPLSQVASSYSQAPTANVGQLQIPHALGQTPFSQEMPSQHLVGMSKPLSASQPQLQQVASSTTAMQAPLNINLQSHAVPTVTNQQQLPAPVQQQVVQSHQQSSSQLAQMLSQQTQTLQATLRSSQQAFSELQQQWQMRQPSNQNLTSQHNFQVSKQQWPGIGQQTFSSSATTLPADVPPSTTSAPAAVVAQTVAPMKCNWTEHMSPEGFKYYYNSVTRESRWEKPEELTLFEQQQQVQQNPFVQQPQTQSNPQVLPSQQVLQAQPVQLQSQPQTQFQHHQSLQQPSFSSSYANSVVRSQQDARELGYTQYHAGAGSVHDPTRFQGHQATQELTWKNKPSGT